MMVPAARPVRASLRIPALFLAALLAGLLGLVVGTAAPASAATSCPCSLWPDTTVPTNPDFNDGIPVELGTQFTADYAGVVTGVRFYKGVTNTGTHVGSLWTATGTLLARVTFGNETASGWQQASFSAPVAISAGTPYVISYHNPTGNYSFDGGYFSAATYVAAPLRAPGGNGASNGLFTYSVEPTFPTGTFNGTNYWVSPVFDRTVASVAVTPNPVSVQSGKTVQLAATATYTDGATADVTSAVTWSATGTATVSTSGLVTGTAGGTAVVTATLGGVSGTTSVTVTAPVLTSITVSPNPVSVIAGVPSQLTATGVYSDGSRKDLTSLATWASSNTTNATVSATGVVTGRAAGSATISATYQGVRATTTAGVRTILDLDVRPGIVFVAVGRTTQLRAVALLSDWTYVDLTNQASWSSGLPGIASVSSTGLVTGRFIGVAFVGAKVGSSSALSTVNVTLF